MSTYKEIIYMVLDELKLSSDDTYFTEEHVSYLINNYRAFILKQRYSDIKKKIPTSNYQTICLDLEKVDIESNNCLLGNYYMSVSEIPYLMEIGNPRVYEDLYFNTDIAYVSKERLKYAGYNKYLKNNKYASVADDSHLYIKYFDDSMLTSVKFTGIFLDSIAASELACNKDCELLDRPFPLEESLIPVVIELTLKELVNGVYKPEDDENNAKDDFSELMTNNNARQ